MGEAGGEEMKTIITLVALALLLSFCLLGHSIIDMKNDYKSQIVSLSLDVSELKQKVETLGRLAAVQSYQLDIISENITK